MVDADACLRWWCSVLFLAVVIWFLAFMVVVKVVVNICHQHILELVVSCMPLLRLSHHGSYLKYIAQFSWPGLIRSTCLSIRIYIVIATRYCGGGGGGKMLGWFLDTVQHVVGLLIPTMSVVCVAPSKCCVVVAVATANPASDVFSDPGRIRHLAILAAISLTVPMPRWTSFLIHLSRSRCNWRCPSSCSSACSSATWPMSSLRSSVKLPLGALQALRRMALNICAVCLADAALCLILSSWCLSLLSLRSCSCNSIIQIPSSCLRSGESLVHVAFWSGNLTG